METIFILFLVLLFTVGFIFVLKDYYREKNAAENKTDVPNNPPKFIATKREKIYIIAIAVLVALVLFVSLICNVLFRRYIILQNENDILKQEVIELTQDPDADPVKSAYEQEMERTIDYIEKLVELYERLD